MRAPVARPASILDPAAKMHVAAGIPYMPYFVAGVLQFQLHQRLCALAGQEGPSWACSIYGSKEAGAALRSMLALGASRPWPEALAALTNTTALDAGPLLAYFAPLAAWLEAENRGQQCGWIPPPPPTTAAPDSIAAISTRVEVAVAVALLGAAMVLGIGLCYMQHRRKRERRQPQGDVRCCDPSPAACPPAGARRTRRPAETGTIWPCCCARRTSGWMQAWSIVSLCTFSSACNLTLHQHSLCTMRSSAQRRMSCLPACGFMCFGMCALLVADVHALWGAMSWILQCRNSFSG